MYDNRPEMDTPEYKAWRYAVLVRDNFTCQLTGQKGGNLQVHHIVPWAKNERLRYVVSNGITLSKEAHDMVTGQEEHYEQIFKGIVNKNTTNQYGRKGATKPEGKKRPYRPKNSRLRY